MKSIVSIFSLVLFFVMTTVVSAQPPMSDPGVDKGDKVERPDFGKMGRNPWANRGDKVERPDFGKMRPPMWNQFPGRPPMHMWGGGPRSFRGYPGHFPKQDGKGPHGKGPHGKGPHGKGPHGKEGKFEKVCPFCGTKVV